MPISTDDQDVRQRGAARVVEVHGDPRARGSRPARASARRASGAGWRRRSCRPARSGSSRARAARARAPPPCPGRRRPRTGSRTPSTRTRARAARRPARGRRCRGTRPASRAIVLFTFFLLCVSDADMNTATSFMPAASAASSPWRLGTSAEYTSPGLRVIRRDTSPPSASCGIHFGLTKLVISMARRPVSDSALMKLHLVVGRDHARLVLQAVARADLVQRDVRWQVVEHRCEFYHARQARPDARPGGRAIWAAACRNGRACACNPRLPCVPPRRAAPCPGDRRPAGRRARARAGSRR